MPVSNKTFAYRRMMNSIFCIIAIVALFVLCRILDLSLSIQQYYSGWVLLALIVSALFFGLKKKMRWSILGNQSAWAQWHYYSGVLTLFLFFIHIEFSVPNGNVESMLALFFLIVALSGLVGLVINRWVARRLSRLPKEMIFETLPSIRQTLKTQAEQLILDLVKVQRTSSLAQFYFSHLDTFFSRPRFILAHLFARRGPYQSLDNAFQYQRRYLTEKETHVANQLVKLMHEKHIADAHWVLQSCLKYWGLLHLPVALSMVLLILLHIVLVFAFRAAA